MEMYKKEKMFEDSLEEFDIARCVLSALFLNDAHSSWQYFIARATCDDLMKEYKACESPDYINYVGYSTQNCGVCWLFYKWSEYGGLAKTQLYYSVSF